MKIFIVVTVFLSGVCNFAFAEEIRNNDKWKFSNTTLWNKTLLARRDTRQNLCTRTTGFFKGYVTTCDISRDVEESNLILRRFGNIQLTSKNKSRDVVFQDSTNKFQIQCSIRQYWHEYGTRYEQDSSFVYHDFDVIQSCFKSAGLYIEPVFETIDEYINGEVPVSTNQ